METLQVSHSVKNGNLTALTSLRFFAAFFIVLLHSEGYFGIPKQTFKSLFNTQPVSFFFVLSGFLMFYSYPEFKNNNSAKKFYRSRIGRIWPIHFLAFLFVVFLSALPDSEIIFKGARFFETFTMLMANIFLVQSWIPIQSYYGSFYAPSWSISTELFFYLMYPAIIYKWKVRWRMWLLGSGIFVILSMLLCNFFEVPAYKNGYSGFTTSALFHVSPFIRIFEFLLGIFAAFIFGIKNSDGSRKWNLEQVKSQSALEIAALMLFAFTSWYSIFIGRNYSSEIGTGLSSWLIHSGSCFSAVLLIYVFACSQGMISKLLKFKPLVLLGEISFTIYMVHGHYFLAFQKKTHPLVDLPIYLQFPIYFVVVILFSYLIWRWFELPARKLIADRMPRQR